MTLSRGAAFAIVVMRVVIGWHFLYEGLAKLQAPAFSAAGYLQQSRGPFASFFKALAADPNTMAWVNPVTMWGLVAVGLGLVLGCFTRLASPSRMSSRERIPTRKPFFPTIGMRRTPSLRITASTEDTVVDSVAVMGSRVMTSSTRSDAGSTPRATTAMTMSRSVRTPTGRPLAPRPSTTTR